MLEMYEGNRQRVPNILSFRTRIIFNGFDVERLPGYPIDDGNDTTIKFYIDYPRDVLSGTLPKATLASIVFSALQKLQNLTGFSIVLNTSVTPKLPANPTENQRKNAVVLRVLDFTKAQVKLYGHYALKIIQIRL
jgi:hypothetical protein